MSKMSIRNKANAILLLKKPVTIFILPFLINYSISFLVVTQDKEYKNQEKGECYIAAEKASHEYPPFHLFRVTPFDFLL
jgi:hypothetical protein